MRVLLSLAILALAAGGRPRPRAAVEAATGLRLGGFGTPVWKWLSAADMAKGIAG